MIEHAQDKNSVWFTTKDARGFEDAGLFTAMRRIYMATGLEQPCVG